VTQGCRERRAGGRSRSAGICPGARKIFCDTAWPRDLSNSRNFSFGCASNGESAVARQIPRPAVTVFGGIGLCRGRGLACAKHSAHIIGDRIIRGIGRSFRSTDISTRALTKRGSSFLPLMPLRSPAHILSPSLLAFVSQITNKFHLHVIRLSLDLYLTYIHVSQRSPQHSCLRKIFSRSVLFAKVVPRAFRINLPNKRASKTESIRKHFNLSRKSRCAKS